MKPELLCPAGSPEALRAAVQNGADAVYLGWGDFNARRNAKNFSDEEFAEALRSYRELPIADAIRSIIWEGVEAKVAAEALFARSLKPEFYGL